MKKVLFVLFAISMAISNVNAETPSQPQEISVQQRMASMRAQHDRAFERRLELTEVQILKARQIRQNAHEKMYPIMEQIKVKKQEAEMIRRSRMAVQMQEEKLAVIDAELKVLEKKASEIRKSNMKDFESLLTRKQKRILKDMKKEGRRRYHSEHPSNMQKIVPMQSFGSKPIKHAK